MKRFLFLPLFLFPVMVFAQASPSPTPGAIQLGSQTLSPGGVFDIALADVLSGKFVAAGAALVLILVYLFRQYAMPKLQLGSGVLPWVAIGSGILVAVASSVLGGLPVAEAVKIALLSGPAAQSIWSSLLKLVLHKDV